MIICGLLTIATLGFVLLAYGVLMNILMRKMRKKTRNVIMTFGRGGHTAEMLYMCQRYRFKEKCDKVYIVIADDDQLSIDRAYQFWKDNNVQLDNENVVWVKIPRSRNNKEGALSSLLQAVRSMAVAFNTLRALPDMDAAISCGAGIALSIFVPYYLIFAMMIRAPPKIFYLESFCRTRNLSLTGKILYTLGIYDRFLVMWPKLAKKYPKAEYHGILV